MDPLTKEVAQATLETAFKNRNQIVAALAQGLKRLKEGKVSVAIFGVGGTGKSTAQLLLTEGIDQSEKNHAYIPTVRPTKKKFRDNRFIGIWDTPGQEAFREAAWAEAFAGLKGSSRVILISIVSYGYNSLDSVTYADLRKESKKTTKEEVIRNYLRLERKKELDLVEDLVEQLRDVPGKIQVLTIVNKQDLWWTARMKVRRHYIDGGYRAAISRIAQGRPKGSVSHVVKEVCLCRMNLKTADDVIVAPTSAGYDAAIRELYFTHLLAALKQLVD